MRAFVMQAAGSAAIAEIGDPVAGDYDAEVDMVVCGICNSTDRMLRTGTFAPGVSYPSILGHESVGRVTSVGRQVRHLEPGQLVTRCSAYGWDSPPVKMHWGGFAERGVVRDARAWQEDHPGQLSADHFPHVVFEADHSPQDIALSISLAETWSIAAEAGGLVGGVVGVSGTGIAGLSLVAFSRLLGAQEVVCVGRRKERLQLALDLGATRTAIAGPEADSVFGDLGGAEVVFEASGQTPAVDAAYRWVRPGGRLIIYSAPDEPVPLNVMAAPREAALIVARPREGAVLRSVVNLVESGALPRELFLSGSYPFDRINAAFTAIDEGSVVKTLVSFGPS
jgi:2-desacetyl-2-hydroxyethyl bacteriochlorophyllide A dehydrogenase